MGRAAVAEDPYSFSQLLLQSAEVTGAEGGDRENVRPAARGQRGAGPGKKPIAAAVVSEAETVEEDDEEAAESGSEEYAAGGKQRRGKETAKAASGPAASRAPARG